VEVDGLTSLPIVNRQAGQSIHLDPLPRSPTTSLTVAGFGFRTIGRLGGLTDQSADCPEAEARHGQTGSG
jgi:hypothetical protein